MQEAKTQQTLEFRKQCREQAYITNTSGQCKGYVQANLVILPSKYANDFKIFCERNPKPCPLIEMSQPGVFNESKLCHLGIDFRRDFPKYKVYQYGEFVREAYDIEDIWRSDLVVFLLGCSFSFEEALEKVGLPGRNVVEKKNVPMFKTILKCQESGVFSGNMVVSMRPYKKDQIERVKEITGQFPRVHGAPVFAGCDYTEKLGIKDLMKPDYGDPVTIEEDDIPVFWACGVTPQNVITQAKEIDLVITHAPGCMLVTDVLNEEFMENSPE